MSIHKRLLIWLFSALILASTVAGAIIYTKTLSDVNEMQDYTLRQTAYSIQYSTHLIVPPAKNDDDHDNDGDKDASDNDDFEFVGQIWDNSRRLLISTHPERNIPFFNVYGIATVSWRKQNWRVFSIRSKSNIVQVVQSFDAREATAADIAERAALPVILLIPALGFLIWGGVAFGLRPLKRISAELSERHAESMEPLELQNLPSEIQSMVLALNDLLKRLSDSLESQRQFIADAAHELRTPLSVLHLQAEIMSRSTDKHEIAQALSNLKLGITRSTHLVGQLLTLARQQHIVRQTPFEIIELEELAKDVIGEMAQVAKSKNIDLGLASVGRAHVNGNRDSLRTLLVNLVDNSIRYIPAGEKIDIHVFAEGKTSILEVTDTGAGIPLAERERVFDRFYRGLEHSVTGSGIGLAIVKSIVDLHHATIALGEGEGGIGLKIRIEFKEALI